MPYEVSLSTALKNARWKIKIREKERCEPPHVTVMNGSTEWRVGLRDRSFLIPPGGKWKELAPVHATLTANWGKLRAAWDVMYPENPIDSTGKEGE